MAIVSSIMEKMEYLVIRTMELEDDLCCCDADPSARGTARLWERCFAGAVLIIACYVVLTSSPALGQEPVRQRRLTRVRP